MAAIAGQSRDDVGRAFAVLGQDAAAVVAGLANLDAGLSVIKLENGFPFQWEFIVAGLALGASCQAC
jgi:hypothetical protein